MKVGRVEQQRMRKALIDAEMELQQGAVATQDRRKTLQARATLASMMHPEHAFLAMAWLSTAWLSGAVAMTGSVLGHCESH